MYVKGKKSRLRHVMLSVFPVSVRVMVAMSVDMTPLQRVSTAIISEDGAPVVEKVKLLDTAVDYILARKTPVSELKV